MSRFGIATVALLACAVASEVRAQGSVIQPTPPPRNAPTGPLATSSPLMGQSSAVGAPTTAVEPVPAAPRRFFFRAGPRWQFAPRWSQPMAIRTDEVGPHPKYRGGFHSSYYYNLGLPSGDIGFRGNGIYWTPW